MDPIFSDAEAVAAFSDYGITDPHLGIGTFKVAYRGHQAPNDLVVKIIKEPLDPDADDADELPERFARELLAMENVNCPHVVRILERPGVRKIGSRSHLWYVEPFFPGPTLEQEILSGGVGPELAVKTLTHLLHAVKAMWESPAKLVHRDIKPGNVISDANGNLVLLDLGIALHADLAAITESFQESPKTRRYAAPEQFVMRRYATIDFRTDLFQIGIVAFEAATGKHPFWTPSVGVDEYMRRLSNFTADQLDGAGLSKQVVFLITRLLAERPSGRYRSIDQPLSIIEGEL